MGLGRVLVVDDEADIRKSVRLILTKAGFDVIEAEDGEKAIATAKSGDNPLVLDTIICDLYMPKVNGMEAIAYFRSQFPSVPVIVLTGQPDLSNVSTLFKQGVFDYLVKPFEPEKLTAVVKKASTMSWTSTTEKVIPKVWSKRQRSWSKKRWTSSTLSRGRWPRLRSKRLKTPIFPSYSLPEAIPSHITASFRVSRDPEET